MDVFHLMSNVIVSSKALHRDDDSTNIVSYCYIFFYDVVSSEARERGEDITNYVILWYFSFMTSCLREVTTAPGK